MTDLKRVMLACKHTRDYPDPAPVVGDVVYCPRCASDQRVTRAPDEWRVKCHGCRFSRVYGVARVSAELAASRHLQKPQFRTHVVDIINGREVVVTLGDRAERDEQVKHTTRTVLAGRYRELNPQGTLFDTGEKNAGTDAPF